ncbi:MAG: DUF3046 domain-containing protein [Demequinaceae bacterium]|nr:DUF3046 domain-containing protein [Demequinaceae bacterium]
MLLSDFWALLDDVFGPSYARTLARRHYVTSLGDRTAIQALEAGIPPRDVWHALCDEMEVPESARDGGNRTRLVPPAR